MSEVEESWRLPLRLLWWAQLASMGAMEMSGPFWPLYLRELGRFGAVELQAWSAAAYAAPVAAALLTAPMWGRMGDRFGHKAMIVRACVGLVVTQALVAFASSAWEVVLYRILQGGFAGFIGASLAYAGRMVSLGRRGAVIGGLHAATAAGSIIGPVIGGTLADAVGYRAVFMAAAIVCAWAGLVLARWLPADREKDVYVQQGVPVSAGEGNPLPWAVPVLLAAIVAVQVGKMMPNSFFALFVHDRLEAGGTVIGLLYAATGLSVMVSAPLWCRRFDRRERRMSALTLGLIAVASAGTVWLHAVAEGFLGVLLVRLAWGLWLGALLPVLTSMLSAQMGNERQGRIIGLGQSATKLGNLLGIAAGAAAAAILGPVAGFEAVGAVYLLAAALLAAWFWRLGHVASA